MKVNFFISVSPLFYIFYQWLIVGLEHNNSTARKLYTAHFIHWWQTYLWRADAAAQQYTYATCATAVLCTLPTWFFFTPTLPLLRWSLWLPAFIVRIRTSFNRSCYWLIYFIATRAITIIHEKWKHELLYNVINYQQSLQKRFCT